MRLEPRAGDSPCPRGEGTTIGTTQTFTVLCGKSVLGDDLGKMNADSLTDCANLCSSFHPKCEAVTFAGNNCQFKANLKPGTPPDRFSDSAMASFPPTQPSDCTAGVRQSGTTNFALTCGTIIDGGDTSQVHVETMDECLAQCVATSGCTALSFDASLDSGFNNCYLKSSIDSTQVFSKAGIDSAQLGTVALAASGGAAPASPPPSTVIVSQPAQTVTAPGSTVVVSQAPSTVTAAAPDPVSAAPVGSANTPATQVTAAPNPPTIQTQTLLSTSANQVISVTELVTLPPVTATGVPEQQQTQSTGDTNNLSWVAAPVVGGTAAILVVVVMFVMFRRRRRREQRSGGWGISWPWGRWPWGSYGTQRLADEDEKGSMPRYMMSGGAMTPRTGNMSRPGTSRMFNSRR